MKVKVTRRSALVIALLASTSAAQPVLPTQGPSFDCTKARSRIDRMICAEETLSDTDRRAADLFAAALSHTDDPSELRRDHRRWLKARDACKDAQCLENRYRERLEGLETFTGHFSARFVHDLCERIAVSDTRALLLARTSGADDLNNDGMSERGSDCAGLTPNALCLSSANERPTFVMPQRLDWNPAPLLGRSAFRHDGRTFIYYSHDAALQQPARVSYVTPTNREAPICEFETRVISAVAEGGHDVCAAIELNEGIEDVELTSDKLPDIDRPSTTTKRAGPVDIDNDGLDESVIELEYASDGCSFNYFDLLNEDQSALLPASRSGPIRELQGLTGDRSSDRCMTRNRLFKFSGKIYFETNIDSADSHPHEVRVLDGTAPATLCTFEREVRTTVKQRQ